MNSSSNLRYSAVVEWARNHINKSVWVHICLLVYDNCKENPSGVKVTAYLVQHAGKRAVNSSRCIWVKCEVCIFMFFNFWTVLSETTNPPPCFIVLHKCSVGSHILVKGAPIWPIAHQCVHRLCEAVWFLLRLLALFALIPRMKDNSWLIWIVYVNHLFCFCIDKKWF